MSVRAHLCVYVYVRRFTQRDFYLNFVAAVRLLVALLLLPSVADKSKRRHSYTKHLRVFHVLGLCVCVRARRSDVIAFRVCVLFVTP